MLIFFFSFSKWIDDSDDDDDDDDGNGKRRQQQPKTKRQWNELNGDDDDEKKRATFQAFQCYYGIHKHTHTHTCHNGILLFLLGVFSSRFFFSILVFHSFIHTSFGLDSFLSSGWSIFFSLFFRDWWWWWWWWWFRQIESTLPICNEFLFFTCSLSPGFFFSHSSRCHYFLFLFFYFMIRKFIVFQESYMLFGWKSTTMDMFLCLFLSSSSATWLLSYFFHKFDLIFSSPSIFFYQPVNNSNHPLFFFSTGV